MSITNDRFKAKNGLDANNQTIINVSTPSASSDAATKGYVDGLITGGTVTSVSGTSGRISSTGGTTPVLDLVTTAVTPGSYTATNLTVDAYGRITAASSTTLATVATTGAYSDLSGTPTIDTLLPSQTGNSGKFLTTDGTSSSWATISGTGTVTSVDASGGTTGLSFTGGPVTTSGTLTLGGTLVVSNGGTGATTLTGYVKGNGTSAMTASSTIPGSDVSGDISGNAANVTGTVAIGNGGTGQTTASAAFNALSPITTTGDLIIGNGTNSATRLAIGTNNYVLTSNGTTASWQPAAGGATSWASGTEAAPGWPNTTTSGTGIYSASSTADISFSVNGKRALQVSGGSTAVNGVIITAGVSATAGATIANNGVYNSSTDCLALTVKGKDSSTSSQNAGALTLNSGTYTGGSGGSARSVTVQPGSSNGGVNGSQLNLFGGNETSTSGGDGGMVQILPGSTANASGGNSGKFQVTAQNAPTRTNAGSGGTGSYILLNCGSGGTNSTTSGTTSGGQGGYLSWTGGSGGAATATSGTGTGGLGGLLQFTAGNGGNGKTTGGAGGYFLLTAGNAGTGGNANAGYFKFIGGTATGTGTPSYFEVNNADLQASGTGTIGYKTGTGGSVTQPTSITDSVTLNKINGQIVTASTGLSAFQKATFSVSNSFVSATDAIILTIKDSSVNSGSNYTAHVSFVTNGTFDVTIQNTTSGSSTLYDAVTINFMVLKGVNA